MKRTPQVKMIRRALGLTQEEFSGRFHIPLGTLRDWEQGAAVPDQSTRRWIVGNKTCTFCACDLISMDWLAGRKVGSKLTK
jgi:transcriptional regulator with XRE-family HTH domain